MKVGEYEIEKGARVSCTVVWKGGRTTASEGTLITVSGDKAYVETSLGPVEVDASTVEPL